jgi:hypothetical protein
MYSQSDSSWSFKPCMLCLLDAATDGRTLRLELIWGPIAISCMRTMIKLGPTPESLHALLSHDLAVHILNTRGRTVTGCFHNYRGLPWRRIEPLPGEGA